MALVYEQRVGVLGFLAPFSGALGFQNRFTYQNVSKGTLARLNRPNFDRDSQVMIPFGSARIYLPFYLGKGPGAGC